ncbi:LysR family transcriptional regulator, partial [Burkholderia pseudomultivorans]|nr:LysR family transcriptional regulator [Burkholderia pseudomultivorans]
PRGGWRARGGVRAAAWGGLNHAGGRGGKLSGGGGVGAAGGPPAAGLAVCPLARRVAPRTLVDVGAKFGLPPLPRSQVVLYSRVRDARAAAALRRFADSLAISA